jgi:Protein of unknown function (Hypoth_ymh)
MPSYKELDQFPDHKQAEFLLSRLVRFSPTGSFNVYSLGMAPWQLVSDFPAGEQRAATELLLSAPLKWLENRGLVRKTQYDNYDITSKGREAAQKPAPSFFANQEIMAALPLLHPDFRGYANYFYENKLKEAVGAAFGRYENKLNEVRDSRGSALAKKDEGKTLVYTLFREKVLVRPYPNLVPKDALEQGLTSIMSGALGWIRNPYTHEKHNLPELTPGEALELLFVASYLMRMLEQAIP